MTLSDNPYQPPGSAPRPPKAHEKGSATRRLISQLFIAGVSISASGMMLGAAAFLAFDARLAAGIFVFGFILIVFGALLVLGGVVCSFLSIFMEVGDSE